MKDNGKTEKTAAFNTPPGAGGAKPEKPPPRRRRYLWLLWLLLFIPLVYFIVEVAAILTPRMRTQIAVQDTMTESLSVKGFVSLQTTPVLAGEGTVYYTVPLGQRVSAGAQVAEVFASAGAAQARASLDEVNSELALLESAQATYAEGGDVDIYLKQIQTGMYGLLDVVENGRYEGLAQAAGEVTFAANRMEVVTGDNVSYAGRKAVLEAEKQGYEALAQPISTLTAPETGFFVPLAKQTPLQQDQGALAAASPAQLQAMLEQPPAYYGDNTAGLIVQDYKWSYYTVVPLKDAERLKEGDKLELAFPDVGRAGVPVVVAAVQPDEAGGIAKIELLCENMSPEVMQLGTERAEIILRTEKGIRIDKKAMRILEGERCVYVKFGNQVFKRPIKILLEDENYLLLSGEYQQGVNEVRLYDEVVVESGGVELYDKRVL